MGKAAKVLKTLIHIPSFILGFGEGYESGHEDGIRETEDSNLEKEKRNKKAISDGLRHGSSLCAKVMNDFKKDKKR